MTEKRINRYPDVMRRYKKARTTIYRAVRDGKFPPPIDFLGAPGWTDEQLDEYDRSRKPITYGAA